MTRDRQLPLLLDAPPLAPAIVREASRRGLAAEASLDSSDLLHVGEIGRLIAGLNSAMDRAAAAGIDVILTPQYQDLPERGRKRCVLGGVMRRLALDVRV